MIITRCVPEFALKRLHTSLVTSTENPPSSCYLEQLIVSDGTDEILQPSYFSHYG